jgi:hypothetical protein
MYHRLYTILLLLQLLSHQIFAAATTAAAVVQTCCALLCLNRMLLLLLPLCILSITAGALVCMMSTSYSQAHSHLGLLLWLHNSSYTITAHYCIRYTVLIALKVVLVPLQLVSVQLAICAAC